MLTSSSLKIHPLLTRQATVHQVSLNKADSLCFIRLIKPYQPPQHLALDLYVVLYEYVDVFSPLKGLPPKRPIEHYINLIPCATLPNAPAYILAPHGVEEIECQLQQFLNVGHIQPICSPCTSPTFIIPKKESGEWHLVTYYIALNKITIKNHYPLPHMEDLLDQLKGAKHFTKMDLTVGYHQVRMAALNTWKTTFKNIFGLYEWMVMPFGLTNALATF